MLEMSTPAGARRDMLEVELSRVRECPAGDLTALVARQSLEERRERRERVLTYLTLSPAGPVSRTLSEPISVSPALLENRTRPLGSLTSNIPAWTFSPDSS